jgi:hypothetical protein
MPYGIPGPPEDDYTNLLGGLEANIDDLGKFQQGLNGSINAGGMQNAKDLRTAFGKAGRTLSKGVRANAGDLDTVANAAALTLVAGAQANAADLSQLAVPPLTTAPPICCVTSDGLLQCPCGEACPDGFHWDAVRKICVPNQPPPNCDCFCAYIERDTEGVIDLRQNPDWFATHPDAHEIGCAGNQGDANRLLYAYLHSQPPPADIQPCLPVDQCPPKDDHGCGPNQHWDEDCQACVPFKCPPGWHWEKGFGDIQCQCVPDKQECPPGTHLDPITKLCVPDCPPCQPADGKCPPPIINVPPCPPPIVNVAAPIVNVTCSSTEPPEPQACPPVPPGWHCTTLSELMGPQGLGDRPDKEVCVRDGPPPGEIEPPPGPGVPPGFSFTCPALPICITSGIGFPATDLFCECIREFESALEGLLSGLIDWANQNITSDALIDLVKALPTTTNKLDVGGLIIQAIREVILRILRQAKPYIDIVLTTIKCLVQMSQSIKSAGNPRIATLLIIVKTMLQALKQWEIGTDAAVWAIDRIVLNFGPLEELLDRLIRYFQPLEIPSASEATGAWLQGQISAPLRDCIWQLNGLNPQMYLPYAIGESERLGPEEVLQLAKRRDLDDGSVKAMMRARGWQRDEDLAGKMELFWELPTIGDHLHWLSRNVDDHDYVKRFGLLDGFSTDAFINQTFPGLDYVTQTDTHGRDFWRTFGHDLTARGMRPEYAANHYAAHWIQPSPEQMREFVYRLRPDPAAGIRGFTLEDYDRILAEQDYAPLARQWFAATLPRVPALTYLIGMYHQGIINEEQLAAYHQDLGYTQADSERFVGVDQIRKNQFRTQHFRGWTPTAIGNAYVVGQLTDDEVNFLIKDQGGTETEAAALKAAAQASFDRSITVRARSRAIFATVSAVTQGLQVGTIEAGDAYVMLRTLKFPDRYIDGIVQSALAQGKLKIVKTAITGVKRAFIDGFIDVNTAGNMLRQIGIGQEMLTAYTSTWQIQNTPRRKRRTASQIVNDLGNGMMDTGEALLRLYNLGYNQADSILYLADARRKILQRQAQALAAQERDARRAANEQQKLAAQADRQARRLRADAMRAAPRSTLQRWLVAGLITPAQFAQRMAAGGYNAADTRRYLLDSAKRTTDTILVRWRKAGIIDDVEFAKRLARLGWSPDDIAEFVREADAASQKKQTPATAGQNGSTGAGGGGAPPGG